MISDHSSHFNQYLLVRHSSVVEARRTIKAPTYPLVIPSSDIMVYDLSGVRADHNILY